jgi:hypothetical protein
MPARNPIPLEGVLNCWNDPYDLPDILLAVSRSGKTGRLSFSNPEGDKTIFVKDGKIVFAESSSDDDGLGQYLLRNGEISLDDFTRVSKLVSPGKRLGALLVAEGVLEPKALVPAVVGQVRAIVLGLFRRTESWYGFKEEEISRKESITLDMPVAQLILEGVQLVESWRRISKGVGNLDAVYQVASATEVEWSRLNLESGPTELLAMLSKPMKVSEICAEAPFDDFDACRYLWAFKSLEWIEPAEISVEPAVAKVPEPAEVAVAAPSIPPRLVATQVSAVKEPERERVPPPPPSPPPRSVPANLYHTQLALDPPPLPPTPAVTRPDVRTAAKPPIPQSLHHTQLFLDASETPAAPAEKTTGEMMEAILDGSGDAPEVSYAAEPPHPEAPKVPEAKSDSATQFFPGASALPPPPPPLPPEEDFFHGSPGFAALSLDYGEPDPTPAPVPVPEPEPEIPLIEASVIEEPPLAITQPSIPSGHGAASGLEFFAMNDPFQAAEVPAAPPTAFATDDPLVFAETSVAASLPSRPRTEELELDIGNFFEGKDPK